MPPVAVMWSSTPSVQVSTTAGSSSLGRSHGPARDVDDPEPRLDRHLVGEVVAPAAHVDPAVDARLGERGHELADVHVHPAAVAGARLGQRRRVQGEDGQAAHEEGQRRQPTADSSESTAGARAARNDS